MALHTLSHREKIIALVTMQDLLPLFKGTLVLDIQIRSTAETQLSALKSQPGFLEACVYIINSANSIPTKQDRIAAAVYFKNTINKLWPAQILDEEKLFIKSNFVPILHFCDHNIKQQLLPTLRILILCELASWSEIFTHTKELLDAKFTPQDFFNDDALNGVYTGLLCISEVTRSFRWIKNDQRSELDTIIEEFFPNILHIGQILLSLLDQLTEFKAEILKLVLKCYKFVTYFDLPTPLQKPELVLEWGQFHGSLINMKLPDYVYNSRLLEQEKNLLQILKVLKWSLANINRMMSRYTTNKKSKYEAFHTLFVNNFLPYLILNLIQIVDNWCQGMIWLNLLTLYFMIEILRNSLSSKALWLEIKPILPKLIENFFYPIIVLDDTKVDTFDTDPHEYINLTFSLFVDNTNAPDVAAVNFIKHLLDLRRKTSFPVIMNLIHENLVLLSDAQETLEVAKKKEALLRVIGAISSHLVNSHENVYYSQMEEMVLRLVLPNVNSQYKFLVARAYDTLGNFSDLSFTDEGNFNLVIYEILKNFHDNKEDNLVVCLENSLCIQSFLHNDQFKENLSVIILPVISKLLDLSNEVDNDAISVVIQECVENFSDQLQPFGVDLVYKLVDNFMRILNEQTADETQDNNEEPEPVDEDKIIAGIGILNTIVTVLLSFESNEIMIKELTKILTPMIKFILSHKNENYLSEVSEIIENLVFLNKQVSPDLLDLLKLVSRLVDDGLGIMYFEELLPALKNYLIYFDDAENENEFIDIYINIFIKMNDNLDSINDFVLNFELVQYFVLILKMKLINYFTVIMTHLLPMFKLLELESSIFFKIPFLNTIICLMIYDSNFVLANLQGTFFSVFLGHWFRVIPKMTRCYDIRLSILGLISLMNNNNLVPNPDFGSNLLLLAKNLPLAMKSLQRKQKLFNADFIREDLATTSINLPDLTHREEEDEDTSDEDINEDHNDYLNFLEQENMKFNVEEDEDLIEDPMEITPLDNINLTEILDNFFNLLKINQDKFIKLFGHTTPEDIQACIALNP